MPTSSITKIKTKRSNLFLRVAKGHFATNHSHSNYYIDVAGQKSRLSEARAVAQELCSNSHYKTNIVDTILCLDGTEVIGACLADELTRNNFMNINAHNTISTCRTPYKNAIYILQSHRQSIHFWFNRIDYLRIEFTNTGVKIPQFVKRKHVLQAFQRNFMAHFLKLAQCSTANSSGGRI